MNCRNGAECSGTPAVGEHGDSDYEDKDSDPYCYDIDIDIITLELTMVRPCRELELFHLPPVCVAHLGKRGISGDFRGFQEA